MTRSQELYEIPEKLSRVIVDGLLWILPNKLHLTHMRFRGDVTLKAVLISHLTLAGLTVPSQPLKPFGLHLVGDVLGRPNFGSRHLCGGSSRRCEIEMGGRGSGGMGTSWWVEH